MASLGIDLVEVKRIRQMMRTWGAKFLDRVFTREELAYVRSRARPEMHLAVRFAAKEAFIKALGSEHESLALPLKSIGVTLSATGKPTLRLGSEAKALLKRRKIREIDVSLSHTHELAVASVILLP